MIQRNISNEIEIVIEVIEVVEEDLRIQISIEINV
jgi:hypothetical protein